MTASPSDQIDDPAAATPSAQQDSSDNPPVDSHAALMLRVYFFIDVYSNPTKYEWLLKNKMLKSDLVDSNNPTLEQLQENIYKEVISWFIDDKQLASHNNILHYAQATCLLFHNLPQLAIRLTTELTSSKYPNSLAIQLVTKYPSVGINLVRTAPWEACSMLSGIRFWLTATSLLTVACLLCLFAILMPTVFPYTLPIPLVGCFAILLLVTLSYYLFATSHAWAKERHEARQLVFKACILPYILIPFAAILSSYPIIWITCRCFPYITTNKYFFPTTHSMISYFTNLETYATAGAFLSGILVYWTIASRNPWHFNRERPYAYRIPPHSVHRFVRFHPRTEFKKFAIPTLISLMLAFALSHVQEMRAIWPGIQHMDTWQQSLTTAKLELGFLPFVPFVAVYGLTLLSFLFPSQYWLQIDPRCMRWDVLKSRAVWSKSTGTVYGGPYKDIEQFFLEHELRESSFSSKSRVSHFIVIYLDPIGDRTTPIPIHAIRLQPWQSVDKGADEASLWLKHVLKVESDSNAKGSARTTKVMDGEKKHVR